MTSSPGLYPLVGSQPAGNFNNAVEVASGSAYVPLIPLGTKNLVNNPYWGGLELIRLQIPVSTAVSVGQASTVNNTFTYTALPNTANLGQNFCVSLNQVPSNATAVQYAWFVTSGRHPVFSTASVAADTAFGVTAAGKFGAISNGKQVLSARIQAPATSTVVKTANLTGGQTFIKVSNTDGWFVGLPVTGTGIPASTTITTIDQDDKTVTLSNAATLTQSSSVTATYNDGGSNFWNIAVFNAPLVQGQIT